MQITVKDRQSLADIAVQYLGGVEGIFALAERNGISITAKLKDGQTLDWELADTVDATVQRLYAAQGVEPATDISQKDMTTLLTATKRYFGGCVIPKLRRDTLIVDAVPVRSAALVLGHPLSAHRRFRAGHAWWRDGARDFGDHGCCQGSS